VNPEYDRKLRDFAVALGLQRSPVLSSLHESIKAEKRNLTANKRSFWVPSLSLAAGVDHMTADNSGSGSGSDFDATEWGVGVGLTLPIFEGGSRFAETRQSISQLSSLQATYAANVLSIGQDIRTSLAATSADFANIASARKQQDAATRNFEMVKSSYIAGVASILAVLDAQTQLLKAENAITNNTYDFLEDLISVEQQLAFYSFLEPEDEVTRVLDELESYLISQE
jgi:outer membrane protein